MELVSEVERDSDQLEAFIRQIEDDLILMSDMPSVHALLQAGESANDSAATQSLQYWQQQLTRVFEGRMRCKAALFTCWVF